MGAELKARDFNLDLEARLGKTTFIGNKNLLSKEAGFYCSVCHCVLKDSITYLDHINGKWHQRTLGMSMRVEKVGVDRIRARIEAHKNKYLNIQALKSKNARKLYENHLQQHGKKEKRKVENFKKNKIKTDVKDNSYS